MMRHTAPVAAALLLAAATIPLARCLAADPTGFITGLGDQLQFVARTVPSEQRPAEFRRLFDQNFAVPVIARFVFGRYWEIASPPQQQELVAAFEDFLIATYSDRLSAYADSGRPPIVIGSRPIEDGAIVSSEVILGRNPTQGGRGAPLAPIRVDWRLIETGGTCKIVDVIVDGVSMAVTQRVDFADEIERDGGQLPLLVASLRERTVDAAR